MTSNCLQPALPFNQCTAVACLSYNDFLCGVQAFKVAGAGITKEYFQSEDVSDAAASLKALDDEDLHDVFVKQVCNAWQMHGRKDQIAMICSLF